MRFGVLLVISSFVEFWGVVHGRDSGIIRQVEGQLQDSRLQPYAYPHTD